MENNELVKNLDITFERIYFEMNSLLMRTDYIDAEGNHKKDIFLNTFKNYLIDKLRELGINKFTEEDSILDIVKYITDYQRDEDKLYNLIHYLISTISVMQSWEVLWTLNSDFTEEERELHVHNGILNKFETGNSCDIYKSFAMIYFYFVDSLILEDDVKKLEL